VVKERKMNPNPRDGTRGGRDGGSYSFHQGHGGHGFIRGRMFPFSFFICLLMFKTVCLDCTCTCKPARRMLDVSISTNFFVLVVP
jgi:hypothetical protein